MLDVRGMGRLGDLLSMPAQGPTWNSHWAGMTSALVPEMLMPAFKHAL